MVNGDEIHDPGRGLSPSRAQANPRPRWQLRLQFWEAWAVESRAKAGVCRPSRACTTLSEINILNKKQNVKGLFICDIGMTQTCGNIILVNGGKT